MSQDVFSAFSSQELQIALSSKLFHAVLNTMPVAVVVMQAVRGPNHIVTGFKCTFANVTAEKISDKPLRGNSIHPTDDVALFEKMAAVVNTGISNSFVHHNADDKDWMNYSISKYDGGILMVYNFTHKEEAEKKIHALNKSLREKNRELQSLNDELKTFTSVAAFDYMETLETLYTNLEFVISHEAAKLSNPGKANLRKAQSSIQKMKLLTDDIVSFSKIQTMDNNLTAVNLNEILEKVQKDLAEKIKEADPEIESEKLPVINGYSFLLTLLFFHLVDNALKFRKPEVRLHLRITHDIVEKPSGNLHRISFHDNGIGFSEEEETEKVFQMFYRIHDKKYKGSGIGLAICRKITELHGGTIIAESKLGQGTTICCFFPV
ncbi:MAG TPA: ATP-binding protein [Flavobacterium sp.]|nr:ATP-binding protein [Flavobacterium sp.]